MKKKRGLRKYFQSLKFRQLDIPEVWTKDGYFSYDKIWVDNDGFNGINKIRPHLDCLFNNFERLADQIKSLNLKFQIWIWINEKDSKDNCIILHSPNPFTTFPHNYKNLSETSNFSNSKLSNYISQKSNFKKLFGISFYENDNGKQIKENFCILYKDNIGESVI
jgi:hypothetical protein